jgi:hypothetical protein
VLEDAASAGGASAESVSYASLFAVSGPEASSTPVDRVAAVVRSAYTDALVRNTPEATFRARLGKVGVEAGAVEALASSFFAGKAAAGVRGRSKIAASLGSGSLVDFDWTVSHVVASDKLAAVGEPLVQLTLRVAGGAGGAGEGGPGGDAVSVVRLELSGEELDAVMAQLERAAVAASAVAAQPPR